MKMTSNGSDLVGEKCLEIEIYIYNSDTSHQVMSHSLLVSRPRINEVQPPPTPFTLRAFLRRSETSRGEMDT